MTSIFDGEGSAIPFRVGNWSVVQDATAPRSPSAVTRMTYPAGFAGGSGPLELNFGAANAKALYVGAWVRWSPNYQNHPTGVNKILHVWTCGINRVVLMARGNSLVPIIGLQQLAAPYTAGGATSTSVHLLPNQGFSPVMTRGAWSHLELYVVANTPGVADGTATLWADGVRVGHYIGIMYCGASVSRSTWDTLKHNPTWGGIGGTVTNTMWLDLDHLKVTGKN